MNLSLFFSEKILIFSKNLSYMFCLCFNTHKILYLLSVSTLAHFLRSIDCLGIKN